MAVNLQKGQKVSLKKGDEALKKVVVGLGWDEAPRAGGGLFKGKASPIDCDASVIMLQGGKLHHKDDMIYFGNLKHKSQSVFHQGDNLTGEGDGDDEQIIVDLTQVPATYDRLVIVVNIYDAAKRSQHFGMIQNAFIRIVDFTNNQEMFKFNLSENISGSMALMFGEIYRHNGEWKFNALGQGTIDPGLGELARRFT